MTEKEKIIAHNMKALGITREEAEQLYLDDMEDYIGEEGEEMTRKAKTNCKTFVQGDIRERKKTKRERKVDERKVAIMSAIQEGLSDIDCEIISHNEQSAEIKVEGQYYTVKLIWNRNKNRTK